MTACIRQAWAQPVAAGARHLNTSRVARLVYGGRGMRQATAIAECQTVSSPARWPMVLSPSTLQGVGHVLIH